MASLTAARMSYAAALVAAVTYGFYFCIAAYTFALLLRTEARWKGPKRVLIAWVAATFIVQTVYFIGGSKWSAIEFVDSTEDPGIFAGQLSSRLAVLKDTCYTVAIWLADGFILYRAAIVYSGYLYFLLLPALLFLGSIAAGIGLLVETAKPGAAFGQAHVLDFGTPFWSLSVSMNVLTTILIAGRLLRSQGMLEPAVGSKDRRTVTWGHGPEVAIFLESAALYAICSLIYIPMFAKDIPLQFPFSALLGSAASIAPHFIIIRMATGKSSQIELSLISLRERATGAGRSDAHSELSVGHEPEVSTSPSLHLSQICPVPSDMAHTPSSTPIYYQIANSVEGKV
ncbi:hypothetical protein GY45DRAFT_1375698 [Cubamyces sp. BRFM 1775]|nr:hypothetical protein GY45DRAFT_1375698 [Cubamyces sp. BRFM 1775]